MLTTLCCPISPPLTLIIGGWGLLILTPLLPFVAAYALLWWGRYHGFLRQGSRLRGRIVGPAPRGTVVMGYTAGKKPVSRPFQLASGDQVVWVSPQTAMLRGPSRLKVGHKATVDGTFGALELGGEHLYRETPTEHGLLAVQVARGSWPRLRGLVRSVAIAWLVCFALILFSAFLGI
jgi:hypothetical protein